jgi:hypothetical protein
MAKPDLPHTANSPNQPRQGRAEKFFQALIQWAPLGGSLPLLISFLLNAQWLQAMLTFPVLVATIGWAAFTEGFLARWQELAKQGGKPVLITYGIAWLSGSRWPRPP